MSVQDQTINFSEGLNENKLRFEPNFFCKVNFGNYAWQEKFWATHNRRSMNIKKKKIFNFFNTLAPKPPLAPNAPKIGAFSKILFSLENGWKPIARLYTWVFNDSERFQPHRSTVIGWYVPNFARMMKKSKFSKKKFFGRSWARGLKFSGNNLLA